MSDIRKRFSLAYDQIDPYARKLVYKTDDQGRTYRDFGDYLYTEDQLEGFMDYMNVEPNMFNSRRGTVQALMDEGRDPMEAVAMSKVAEMVPLLNAPYVADDVYGGSRKVRDAYQEGRPLDMLGHIAMLGLDVAPALVAGGKGVQIGARALKSDAANKMKMPISMRRQPRLSSGLLFDVEDYLSR